MLILFLDDEQIRHDLAVKYLGAQHTILHAFNADEAISLIKSSQQRIGMALLDHDLQEFVSDEDGYKWEKHGGYFVRMLIDMIPEDKLPAQIIIHSYNEPGAEGMKAALKNKGITALHIQFSGSMLRQVVEMLKSN